MWNKKLGAQILLYGSYVGAVLLVIAILMMLVGGAMFGSMIGLAGRGFLLGLIMAIIYGAVGGFTLWLMYSVGSEYLQSGTYTEWKVWVVLVLSSLGALSALMRGGRGIISLLIEAIFIFGAAALLWAPEE